MTDLDRARRILHALQGDLPDAEWQTRYAALLQLELDAQQRRYAQALGPGRYQYLADPASSYPLATGLDGAA